MDASTAKLAVASLDAEVAPASKQIHDPLHDTAGSVLPEEKLNSGQATMFG